jgi:2-dehydro-3-deoxyglucarate aldolase
MLKDKLRLKEFTLGSWLMSGSPVIADVMATAGLEWLVIDHEHTCTDFHQIDNLISRIQKNKIEALVRVAKNDEVFIKKALDAGANGVVIPMVKSLEDAKRAIDYCYYPPFGKRGVGLFTAQGYGYEFEKYVQNHRHQTTVIFQIEHVDALRDIDSMTKLEGVDGFIIGPYDFSASMGKPGKFDDPEISQALSTVEREVIKSGKSLGYHIVQPDTHLLAQKKSQGYSFFAFSIDYLLLGNSLREKLNLIKEGL